MGILKDNNSTFECAYSDRCASANSIKCKKCSHNKKRNFIQDFYQEANDNEIPDNCPPLRYNGPAEQTAGYCCPVCGGYTNPYSLNNNLCSHCGYRLVTAK